MGTAHGLVHHEVGDTAKVGLAGLEHVDETAGRGDDDFGTTLKVAVLTALRDSTVQARVAVDMLLASAEAWRGATGGSAAHRTELL